MTRKFIYMILNGELAIKSLSKTFILFVIGLLFAPFAHAELPPTPFAPSGLYVTDEGTDTSGGWVSLSWNANTETYVDGYYVMVHDSLGISPYNYLSYVWVEGRTNASYKWKWLTIGEKYYFIVTATDIYDRESNSSNTVSAIPGPPANPTGLLTIGPGIDIPKRN